MKYRWFAKLVLSGMLSVGVTLDAQSQERVAYDKCILSNVATVKDRYALDKKFIVTGKQIGRAHV